MTPGTAALWIKGAIGIGSAVLRGVDPRAAAEKLNDAIRARGGDPKDVWLMVHRVSAEQLEAHQVPACACVGRAVHPSHRCLTCGGVLENPTVKVEIHSSSPET